MPGSQPAISAPGRPAPPSARDVRSPPGRLLGNGHFRTLLTEFGTGGAWLGDDALTAWRGDRIEDSDGWFVYLRDMMDGAFWSLGARPVEGTPDACGVEDGPGWMALTRTERGIAGRMEVWVDPECHAECRRITLRNLDDRPRVLDLTSMLEVVLQHPRHHADHPGFSKLFVQTGYDAAREALIAWRRPRSAGDRHPWLLHRMRGAGELSRETDRGRFLGRGRGPESPQALIARAPLSGTVGDVLDPILALRRTVDLAPRATMRLDLLLAAGESREAVLAVADRLADATHIDASRERAAAARGPNGDGAADPRRLEFERLAATLLYRDPALRDPSATGPIGAGAIPLARRAALPIRGPLVLVEAGTPTATVEFARAAQACWRAIGFETTLVIVSDREPPASDPERARYVLAAGESEAEDLARLRAAADLHLDGDLPSLAPAHRAADGTARNQVRGAGVRSAGAAGRSESFEVSEPAWPFGDEALRAFNGWGGFSTRGDEYVIRLPRDASGAPRLTPRPWINVLANPGFGALISESGAGCTWSRNSRELRLTPWSNDAVRDPHDEALYLRDERSGRLWSPFAGPIPGRGRYEMRHGFGISRCRHSGEGLVTETEVFVHASEPVKVTQVRVTNPGRTPRRFALTACQRLVLGAADAAHAVSTWEDPGEDPGGGILFARTRAVSDHPDVTAFAATVIAGDAVTRTGTDRGQILGPGGSPARPAALLAGEGPDGRTGSGFDPCFCQQVRFDLGPGESRTCAFLLGEAPEIGTIEAIVSRLRRPGAIDRAREAVIAGWTERLGRVRIETPSEPLDLLANGWLAYQALACRLWARTAFYQSGGAFGYRDQLQDAAAFLAFDPGLTHEQILLHCAHQFAEGDVLHWWHPPRGRGIRTRFADDLLWLPYVTASYVAVTGDQALLGERTPFLVARPLAPGEDEAYLLPEAGPETGDVYEHCCRALDRALGTGAHGLPLFGSGDWNDGMNRVGREGRGESVWMAFFLYTVIDAFLPLCERRGDGGRAARLRAHQGALRDAIELAGWDGAWYRRGYYDDGTPLGAAGSEECRIDALVQAWSVLSGAVPRARAERALDAMTRELVSWEEGTLWLLAPPFDRTPHDPGYIKGYVPGVRENGGQYTHAALWGVAAMARLGRREEAVRLLERLSPVWRARTADDAAVYQVEPYVIAADVYSNPQNRCRGGWTWYTGSAGWMLRVTLESILGVTLEGGSTLVVRPSIPAGWPGYRMRLRPFGRSGTYEVEVRNSSTPGTQVAAVTVDGRSILPVDGVARVPIQDDGIDHRVEIRLR